METFALGVAVGTAVVDEGVLDAIVLEAELETSVLELEDAELVMVAEAEEEELESLSHLPKPDWHPVPQ
jgi:hypothetical protein